MRDGRVDPIVDSMIPDEREYVRTGDKASLFGHASTYLQQAAMTAESTGISPIHPSQTVGSGGMVRLRPHSTPETLLWLEANYEMADGVCIPRSTLYSHYVDFCADNQIHPVNPASFGKVRLKNVHVYMIDHLDLPEKVT